MNQILLFRHAPWKFTFLFVKVSSASFGDEMEEKFEEVDMFKRSQDLLISL